jgi:hypothetical protein
MGLSLVGERQDRRISHGGWAGILELAREGGWEPAGTEANHMVCESGGHCICDGSRGSYHDTNGAIVTAEDARALATALERMLPPETLDPALAWFVEPRKAFVQDMIAFCREGRFSIW